MKLPLQITFRNIEGSEAIEEWIRSEAAKLETFCDRIMGCRVVVELPHVHRKRGNLYHVRIYLTLPGGELVIKRQPSLSKRAGNLGLPALPKGLQTDGTHVNLRSVINDSFRAAARRLQDYVRRQRGDTKRHEALPLARVIRLLPGEDYGFLQTDDGREIYFHRESVLNHGFDRIREGTTVAFVEEKGDKGPQASTVRVVHGRRRRELAHATAFGRDAEEVHR